MFARRLYYNLKPIMPWSVRIAVRRWRARRILHSCSRLWPIVEGSQRPPQGWPGWPEGKQFAFVLTHDVEGCRGLNRCRQLMALDAKMGFHSSFNFIPEGEYQTPKDLRMDLIRNGFEVGVHDLRHDGKLYRSKRAFRSEAKKINPYIKEWEATGFRSGFMHHNLDWLHDLDIVYDASTFDTDPFEPQPDGVHTIFPFIVPGPNGKPGYVELPYTLVQDFSLFVVLKETTIDIWKRKLDWIAQAGGMALVNVHPDYVNFGEGQCARDEFPVRLYQELLEYVRTQYGAVCWQALPREVAQYTRSLPTRHIPPQLNSIPHRDENTGPAQHTIWVDLDNTPHVPFFRPIIRELKKCGYNVVVTARDAYQVCELADHYGMEYNRIGHHYGKNPFRKIWGTGVRTVQLLPFARRHRPSLSLSHGSRSQIMASNILRVPSVLILDYEHAKGFPLAHPTSAIVPRAVATDTSFMSKKQARAYDGIKEDVYAPEFKPDNAILKDLQLDSTQIIITVRPPASEAHYHNPESDKLFKAFMDWVCEEDNVQVVLLPRNKNQELALRQQWSRWVSGSKVIIPETAVDGLNLLWHSDLVVSGGGTMNREAAALGVTVYSIFRGRIGAVDRHLAKEGRLILIESVDDLRQKIVLKKRPPTNLQNAAPSLALRQIIEHVEDILREHQGGKCS